MTKVPTDARPLDVRAQLAGARLVVIGATGFLGKVWLSLLLCRYPQVGKIFLVVRGRNGQEPEARFWTDVAPSEPFAPLRELHPGVAYDSFLRARIEVIDADVSRHRCGFAAELVTALEGTIDAVVNVAGVVDFNPPLDDALHANAAGVQNLVALARALGDVPVLHTSTCYVAGYRTGQIEELDPREAPFPRHDDHPHAAWDPSREVAEGLELVAQARARAHDAFRQSGFREQAAAKLESRGEPATGEALNDEVQRVMDRYVRDVTAAPGIERAKYWGWPNVYTYTKSLGEQLLAGSGLRFTIVRPAVIESAMRFPSPGWNEGINTMAPLMYLFMKGHIQVPYSPRAALDIIPVDMVAGGMISALAALLEGTQAPVYHLGTSDTNAVPMGRVIELCGLYKRMHYQRTGKGNPWVNFVQAHWEPVGVSPREFYRHSAPALASAARGLSGMLQRAAAASGAGIFKPAAKALASYADMASKSGEIWELFIPFMAETDYRFVTANVRGLRDRMSPEDRAAVGWAPEAIDWRMYMHEVHLPGLDRWVLPQIEARTLKPEKPRRAFVSLVDLVAQAAERHEHAPALLRAEPDGFSRVTYAEVYARALATAARLAEAGVVPGDRVLLSGANHPDWVIACVGILRAGATVVPVDSAMERGPLTNVLRASGAGVAVLDAAVTQRLGELNGVLGMDLHACTVADTSRTPPAVPPPTEDTLASLIYTSGTTAAPKGVMLTHGNFTALVASLMPVFPLTPGDRVLSVLPLHHTFEFTCGLLLPLACGARVVYLDELTGEKVVGALRDARVTAMVGVPALWQLLERRILAQVRERGPMAERAFDFALAFNRVLGNKIGVDIGRVLFGPVHTALGGSLKYVISGGAALPRETAEVFAGLGLHLAEGYGLTEAAPVLTVARAKPGAPLGDVGSAIPGVEVKIHAPDARGVGEVIARGRNVMAGYADDPVATERALDAAGWLHTGDLGRMDSRGRLTIVGRDKDVVVSATGENVYPDDVERTLGEIEGIAELTVVGIADPHGGERVALLAVVASGDADELPVARAVRRDEAMQRLRVALQKLSPTQRPAVVMPWHAPLPKTSTRKVKRAEVRAVLESLVGATEVTRAPGDVETRDARVRSVVAALAKRPVAEITESTRLRADLGFDSLMTMELVAALEAAIGAQAMPEGIGTLETVGEIEGALGLTHPLVERDDRVQVDKKHDETLALPDAVRDVTKAALGLFQREFYGTVMRPKVTGRAHIPHNRACLVVANHASHLDMGLVKYALGSYGEDLVALAARDYFFATPLRRSLAKNFTNLAPIDRDAGLHQTLRGIGQLLEQGRTVLIFPEGTRSPDGALRRFKGAVGFLALQYGVDILPVHLSGTYEAMSRDDVLPRRRDVTARIGPVLSIDHLRRLTADMRPVESARTVTKLTQRAVESLRDGSVLDIASLVTGVLPTARRNPLADLFDELNWRFVPGQVDSPVSFYFALGAEPDAKWSVSVTTDRCEVHVGRPAGGTADCVLKTSPEIFARIVREGYTPGVTEFMAGTVKSNDVGLLQTFQRAFQLG